MAFPIAASVPDTSLSLAWYQLLSPANPAVNALCRKVWELCCGVNEWKQFAGGFGGCNKQEQSC